MKRSTSLVLISTLFSTSNISFAIPNSNPPTNYISFGYLGDPTLGGGQNQWGPVDPSNTFYPVPVSFSLYDSNNSFFITPGQPFGSVFSVNNSIGVVAGRHDSTWVVSHLFDKIAQVNGFQVTSNNAQSTNSYSSSLPEELNFGMVGTLNFTEDNVSYTCSNIALAQGSNYMGNNWWIFSNLPNSSNIKCANQNGQEFNVEITGIGTSSQFRIVSITQL